MILGYLKNAEGAGLPTSHLSGFYGFKKGLITSCSRHWIKNPFISCLVKPSTLKPGTKFSLPFFWGGGGRISQCYRNNEPDPRDNERWGGKRTKTEWSHYSRPPSDF